MTEQRDETAEDRFGIAGTRLSPRIVVGIGSSVAGFEALEELLAALGDRGGDMALVVVQHLDASQTSFLPDLLRTRTSMPVHEARNAMPLERGHVYVIPPSALLTIEDDRLHVTVAESAEQLATPIDDFLRSLAAARGHMAVAIILAGTGIDGTIGIKAITDAGGMTMAQDVASARYDSTPRHAAILGVADHVLPPARMPAELLAHCRHLASLQKDGSTERLRRDIAEVLPTICDLLYQHTDLSFHHYKTSTLLRRVERRMQVLQVPTVAEYVDRLRASREEPHALFKELLIGVTAFFRDPEAFEALAREVVPRLLERRSPVRIWVPGCATGEEAYSIAMLVSEHLERIGDAPEFQIFATDIDDRALAVARQGIYPQSIAESVSRERLERFFVKRGNHYHVKKELREYCLFSAHNIISDPPFSRLDLISCRNLLIYLGPQLQKKLMAVFHYALRPNGYLFLGPSESITSHEELFLPVNAKSRISQRKPTAIRPSAVLSRTESYRGGVATLEAGAPVESDLAQIAQRVVLDEFAPKYAVVNEVGQILCTSGGTGRYLEASAGAFQNNIVSMARAGLRVGLRAALAEAARARRAVIHDDLSVGTDAGVQSVKLIVQPMPRLGEPQGLYMVVFQDLGGPMVRDRDRPDIGASEHAATVIEHLERELTSTRADLEKTIVDLETSNEELKSSNEELLSMNEELQSANEELETSKEEIQVANEALARAHTDLQNFFASTRIATIVLDETLNIQSFTPAVAEIYNLITSDIGRPLAHITHRAVEMPPLPDPASLRNATAPIEHELRTIDGHWYMRRVLPYRTHEDQTQGMVITFTDVTALRESERASRTRMAEIEAVYRTAPVGLAVFDADLRCIRSNERLAELTRVPTSEHVGRTAREVMGEEVGAEIDRLLEQVRQKNEPNLRVELRGSTPNDPTSERVWLCSFYPIPGPNAEVSGINVVLQDISALKNDERARQRLATLVESSADFVGVARLDGRLVYLNRAGQSLVGLDDEDAARSSSIEDCIYPEDLPFTRSAVLPAALTEGRWAGDLRFRHLVTGEPIDVFFDLFRIDDPASGSPMNLATVTKDARAQKRAVDAIRETGTRLRAIVDAAADAIVTFDERGTIESINPATMRLFGYHPEELIGRTISMLIPGLELHTSLARRPAPSSQIEARREVMGTRKDGTTLPLELVTSEMSLDGQRLFTCLLRDITERRLAESEREARLEELSRTVHFSEMFVGVLGHDLRNPLHAIMMGASMLLQRKDTETISRISSRILRSADRMARMIDQLLDFTRIRLGRGLPLERKRVDLGEVGRAVIEELQVLEPSCDVKLEATGDLVGMWDRDRLAQLLSNLVGNALEHRRASTSVLVHLDGSDPHGVRIEVWNQGAVPEDLLPVLFEPLRTRSPIKKARGSSGLGLGLFISQQVVRAHGGTLEVRSSEPEGTTFSILIPRP
ncbi:CheR family methyltransferase [Polyangium aurulentum]|uniref:CheR family methyltransferase n=1 Tax=Polyangium aurulentum TaxID=2567896 RepID=UPI0010AE11E7|nr:CheR family methyltransferase [Polyangium aurulentum]UQA58478.1 PAS domain S-box protein [Polyangium aurulentum]